MDERLHLPARHRRTLEALLRKHLPGVEVWAYGSRVNGRSHDGSDLDLALRGSDLKAIPVRRLGDLEEALQESNIPLLVEARDWARLPERFHREIERDHVVLVEGKPCESTEWQEVSMEEISEKIGMGPFGSSIKVETFAPEGVPVISGRHLHGVRVDDTPGFNFITEEHARRLNSANVTRGDIILTHRGNIGQVSYIPEWSFYERYVASQSQFYMRCDRHRAIPQFMAYWFNSPEGQHKLLANSSQVGVPSIARPVSYLRTITLRLPPLPEQRAIARILGALDDRIELNRRMNETLEAMARVLFKSWFVDFDPVRAKAEGRDTSLPDRIADLFPNRLVDSELGEIPEGWQVGNLADISTTSRQSVDPASLDSDTPYIGLEHMPRRSIALADWGNIEQVTSNKSVFKKDDILFGKLRPYFHKVGVAPINGVCSTDVVVIVPKAAEWSAFATSCVSSVDFVGYTDRTSTGTKMPRTSWKVMSSYRLCLPETSVAQAFQNVVQPILDRIVSNIHEARSLSTLRDTLLPRLVSGELRLGETAERLEGVA